MLTAVLVLGASTLCQGRVFTRWRAARHGTQALETLGGKSVYESRVVRNGHEGVLSVLTYDENVSTVVGRMVRLFPGSSWQAPRGTTVLGGLTEEETSLRWVAVQVDVPARTTVFQIEEPVTPSVPESPEAPSLPPSLPVYPNSRPLFAARLEADGAHLATALTTDSPAAVDTFYETSLVNQGWTRVFPSSDGPTRVGVYLRPKDLCLVSAEPANDPAYTRIAVLHKPQGVK